MKIISNHEELGLENKMKDQPNPTKRITVFVYNNTDGLGDFKHGLDMYTELSKQYKGTDTKIKLIALVDSNKSKILPNLIAEDQKHQVFFSQMSHPEQIKQEEYNKEIIILSDWLPEAKDKPNKAPLNETVTRTIQDSSILKDHLKNTDFYLNVSMQVKFNSYLFEQVKDKCFKYSVCEYGPMIAEQETAMFKKRIIPVAECSLGFRNEDAGVKFDEAIWEHAKLAANDSDKLALLATLVNKKLLTTLLNSQVTPDKSQENYFKNNYLAIGYVQNQQATNNVIATSIDSSENKKIIDIFVPHKFLSDQSLMAMLKEKNISSLVKINTDGVEEVIHITNNNNGKICRCIDFQGLNEHDRKILTSTANIIAGSGDNSFSDALSNPNALPLFQLSPWKKYFYDSFIDYMKSHNDGSPEYQLLVQYLQLMGISDENHNLNRDSFYVLVKNHHEDILVKWKEVLNKLHQDHNYTNNLKILQLASNIYDSLNSGESIDTVISNPDINQLLNSDNIFAHRALLVAGVSANNPEFIKYVCSKLEFLPTLSENNTFTDFAIENGWKDAAAIVVEKDFEFLKLIMFSENFYYINTDLINYFNGLEKVNIAFSVGLPLIEMLQNHSWLQSQVKINQIYNKVMPSEQQSNNNVLTEYMKGFYILRHGDSILCCKNGDYFQLSWNNKQMNKEAITEPTLRTFQALVKSWQARALAEEMGTYIPTVDDLVNNQNYPLYSQSSKLKEVESKILTELQQLKNQPSNDDKVKKEIALKLLLSVLHSNHYNYDLLKIHLTHLEPVKDIAYSIYQIALEEQADDVINSLMQANLKLTSVQQYGLLDHYLKLNQFQNICTLCSINPEFIEPFFKIADSDQLISTMLDSFLTNTFHIFESKLNQGSNKINIIEVFNKLKNPQIFEAILQVHNDAKAISIMDLAKLSSSDALTLLNNPMSSYNQKYDHLTKILFEENRIEILKFLITKLDEKDTERLCDSFKSSPDTVIEIRRLNSANITPRLRADAYIDKSKPSSNEQPTPDSSLRPPRS